MTTCRSVAWRPTPHHGPDRVAQITRMDRIRPQPQPSGFAFQARDASSTLVVALDRLPSFRGLGF
jgi:hypothetical protein